MIDSGKNAEKTRERLNLGNSDKAVAGLFVAKFLFLNFLVDMPK